MKAERDWLSGRFTQAALRAEDQKTFAAQFGRVPAHAGVLGEAEEVAARFFEQHPFIERQAANRPGRAGAHLKNVW